MRHAVGSAAVDALDLGGGACRSFARRCWSRRSPAGTTRRARPRRRSRRSRARSTPSRSPRSTRRSSSTSRSTRPTIRLERGPDPRGRLAARTRCSPRGRRRRRARPGAGRGHRAEPALAHLRGGRDRGRRATRGRDGRDARRAARRRRPHAAGADHRPRLRPGAGRARSTSSRSSYEGPTGIVGVLHDACRRRGLDSASLWAAVPHYVAAVPNPKAALALLRRLEGFTGVAVEASELEEEMGRFEDQVDRAVAANPEIEELVQRLEAEQADELDRARRGHPLRRHDRPGLPALPAPALRRARRAPT